MPEIEQAEQEEIETLSVWVKAVKSFIWISTLIRSRSQLFKILDRCIHWIRLSIEQLLIQ
jgi:hypothetical protein